MAKTPEELQAELDALAAKNKEILDEKKKGDKALKDLTDQVAALTKDRDDTKSAAEEDAAKKAGDWAKLETQLKEKHTKELKERDDTIATLQTARDSLVLDSGLSEAIAANGVAEHFRPAVLAMLKTQGPAVKIEDGKFVGYIGDKKIGDAVKEFTASDQGKHFVTNSNSGGGSPGGGAPGSANNPYKKGATFNRTEQGRLEKADPTLAAKLKAEAA